MHRITVTDIKGTIRLKTKVGQKWYQSIALWLPFSRWCFFFFNLKEHHFKFDQCRINVASAANSLYLWANFNNHIYTGKLISSHSYIPVICYAASVVQNLQCPLSVCSRALNPVCSCSGVPIYMPCVVALALIEWNLSASCYKFVAAGANLIHQANFFIVKRWIRFYWILKDGVPLNWKMKYPVSMLKEGLSIDMTFNPA
jgi:hypothetical protein